MARRWTTGLAAAALVVAAILLFGRSVGFGFIRFDDADYTFGCAFVSSGLKWANVVAAFRDFTHAGIWMPLTNLTYMTDVSWLGGSAAAFHATGVLWHALNAALLWTLAVKLTGRARGSMAIAWLAVLIWTVHPQRVEAVAWIASRKELVWSAFALSGLIAWLDGRRWLTVLCALGASLSKPTAMAFPFLVLAVDVLAGEVGVSAAGGRRRADFGRWSVYAVLLAIAVATGAVTVFSQMHPTGMAAKELFYFPLGHRLLNAANATGLALAQGLVPWGIHLDYRTVDSLLPLGWQVGLPAFALAAVGLVYGIFVRRSRTVLAMALFFFAALVPTLGVFGSFGEQARADRFLYVPMMAFVLVATRRTASAERRRFAVAAALAALAMAYTAVTWQRVGDYRDDERVFSRSLAVDPDHGRALLHLGEDLAAKGELDRGIANLRRSCELRPRVESTGKLAYALMRRGRSEDMAEIRRLCAEIAAKPKLDEKGQALEALGTAELSAGEWRPAAEHLALSVTAAKRFYSAEDAMLKLAYALHNSGRRKEAERIFAGMAKSGRSDLAEKAERAIEATADDPHVILFW